MIDHLHRLLDHMEWANRRALEAARGPENEKAMRLLRGPKNEEIVELLSHLLACERLWLERIETGDSAGREIWPDLSFEENEELLEQNVEAYRQLLDSLSEEDVQRKISYRNSEGREYDTPLGEILLHVFLHGTYHRGQVAARLSDGGHEPVNTDFITFVRKGPRKKRGAPGRANGVSSLS